MVEYASTNCVTNIFDEPNAKSDLITQIDDNSSVAVLEHGCMWSKIIKDAYVGFCKTENLKFENNSEDLLGDKESTIMISIPRDCACALYNALKFSFKIE